MNDFNTPPQPPQSGPVPQLPPQSGTAHDPFQAAKASAMRAAEELRHAATQKAQDLRHAAETQASHLKASAEEKVDAFRAHAADAREYADQAIHQAQDQYAQLRDQAEQFAREKPMQALLTAFGVGFLVGIILKR